MRLKLIACKVISREIGLLSAQSKNTIDITTLRQGLHNEPEKLREALQREIDLIDRHDDIHSCNNPGSVFDAILLGYGLCSNGVVGVSSKKYPIVIPRAHDCATLFLGSKERYKAIFDEKSGGVYWYTPGWIENTPMPSAESEAEKRELYNERYGEENADYLIETEREWLKNYHCLAYVETPGICAGECRAFTKRAAAYFGLDYAEYDGSLNLLQALLEGDWDAERFLILPPGASAEPSYDSNIVRVKGQS